MSETSRGSGKISLASGDIVSGKYRVERPIAEGRTAVVYEAINIRLDERVALKMLKKELRADPDMAARFTREAHALAKLRSEHVARAIDVEDLPDGTSIMVMEFLDGQTLERILLEGGPLSIERAADFTVQTCEGLGEAHSRGIVHRDVKPENMVIVKRDGWLTVKLLDFGISKAALSPTASAIRTQSVMGSPVYMSPEQLRSTQDADARADVWSLGAVLFEMLTAHTAYAYEGRSLTELISTILEQPPRRLAEFRPDLPPEIQSIVDRCLEKDRSKRYQSTAELAVAILPFAPSRSRAVVEKTLNTASAAGLTNNDIVFPPSVRPPAKAAQEDARRTLSADPEEAARELRTSTRSRTGKRTIVVLVALAIAGVAAGAVFRLRRHTPPPAETVATPAPMLASEALRPAETASAAALQPMTPPPATPPSSPLHAPLSAPAPAALVGTPPRRHSAVSASRAPSGGAAAAVPEAEVPSPPVLAVAAPTPTPAPGPPSSPAPIAATPIAPPTATGPKPGTVDPQGVSAVVRAHSGEFRSCFDQARMFNQDLHGRVTVQASVAPDGSASGASVTSSTVHDARLEACLASTFGRLKFPQPAGGVAGSVSKTFNFE